MTRRLLTAALIGLGIANVLVFAAWIFRDGLQDAGVLPTPDQPVRVTLPERPLPAIDATAGNLPEEASETDAETLADPPSAPPTPDAPGPATPTGPPTAAQAPTATASRSQTDDAAPPDPLRVQAPAQDAAQEPDASTPAEKTAAAQPPTETKRCVLAGAFETRDLAVQAHTRLAAESATASVVVNAVAGDPHYLVHVAPAGSRAEAEGIGGTLRAQGLDSYVIPSGERAHGVSVGLFKSEQRAQAQKARVTALGYDVRVTVRNRERLVYRVRVTDVAPAALADLPQQPCADAPTDAAAPIADAPAAQ